MKRVASSQAISLSQSDDMIPHQFNCLRELLDSYKKSQQQEEGDLTLKFIEGIPTIVFQTPIAIQETSKAYTSMELAVYKCTITEE